ncbi:MAG: hypothetical protein M1151_06700 [Candidatus Thermoplasmatota archaeon]|jgi:uncharacterized membrane protein|nr:hypothetical protein [Candidatus Thermoplasmatota archaeon]MCL5786337.1 hypothetical protein [Candidatus Thermoplasmatota archaeon]
MDENDKILYIFAYLLTWLSGIIVYVLYGSKNENLRFHSIQAILLGIVITAVWILGQILTFAFVYFYWIYWIFWLVQVLGWIYGLYVGFEAYNGRNIEMPVIGQFAKQQTKTTATAQKS